MVKLPHILHSGGKRKRQNANAQSGHGLPAQLVAQGNIVGIPQHIVQDRAVRDAHHLTKTVKIHKIRQGIAVVKAVCNAVQRHTAGILQHHHVVFVQILQREARLIKQGVPPPQQNVQAGAEGFFVFNVPPFKEFCIAGGVNIL